MNLNLTSFQASTKSRQWFVRLIVFQKFRNHITMSKLDCFIALSRTKPPQKNCKNSLAVTDDTGFQRSLWYPGSSTSAKIVTTGVTRPSARCLTDYL